MNKKKTENNKYNEACSDRPYGDWWWGKDFHQSYDRDSAAVESLAPADKSRGTEKQMPLCLSAFDDENDN